mgnify:CR=1 FL=1
MKITSFSNPRQTILLTCRDKGKDNVMTLDWHMPLSFDPMMYAVSIGKSRFSLKLIQNSKVFVVNFIPKEMEKEAILCGRSSGRDIDKFEEFSIEKEEAKKVNCPRIKNALAWLECEVEKEIETGDHILFIAKVVFAEKRKEGKRLFHLYLDKFTTTLE